MKMLNLRRQASETMTDVSDAAKKTITTTEWATVALVAVAGVSLLALAVALVALSRSGTHE